MWLFMFYFVSTKIYYKLHKGKLSGGGVGVCERNYRGLYPDEVLIKLPFESAQTYVTYSSSLILSTT